MKETLGLANSYDLKDLETSGLFPRTTEEDSRVSLMLEEFSAGQSPILNELELAFIGEGRHSIVYADPDGLSYKYSNLTSGEQYYKTSYQKVENLVFQYKFLQRLRDYLEPNSDLICPEQFLVAQNNNLEYLKIEEYMKGFIPIKKWGHNKFSDQILEKEKKKIQRIIKSGVSNFLVGLALNDVGYRGVRVLSDNNILIRETADQVEDSPICIIDQPAPGVLAKLSTRILTRF